MDADPDFKVLISETFLGDGKLDSAKVILLEDGAKDSKLYPVIVKLLQELIAKKDVDRALDVMMTLIETSVQRHDEITLKIMLESILALDESNIRTLKALTTLLVRMNDTQNLEGYLKRLVVAQLRAGDLLEGRDGLNQLVIYGRTTGYLDLLRLLNEAIAAGTDEGSARTCQRLSKSWRMAFAQILGLPPGWHWEFLNWTWDWFKMNPNKSSSSVQLIQYL